MVYCHEMNIPRHPIQMETEPNQQHAGVPVAAPPIPTALLLEAMFRGGQKQVSSCEDTKQSLFLHYYILLLYYSTLPPQTTVLLPNCKCTFAYPVAMRKEAWGI